MLYILLIFLIIIIILLLFKNNIESYENNKINVINANIKKYKEIMFNNNEKKLYKIGLNENIDIREEDCFDKCDHSNCLKMMNQKKILNQCLECNKQKNKCFNKSIIGGNCDDCSIENNEDKLDCYDVNNFGCPNPENINFSVGINPYYVQVNDNNLNSPYDKKCIFCWNILGNI